MIDVKEIIEEGIYSGASDVHLICDMKPIFRINRDLVAYDKCEILKEIDMYQIYQSIIQNNPGKDETFARERKLDMHYDVKGTRTRVNVSLSNDIPVFTIRIINKELPRFKDLGLPDIVRRLALLPQGLILVTGKSNMGKTTTLNALVNEINEKENKKILMLESPIEYVHESKKSLVVQKEIGEGKDCLTYSDGVINALREDCDILIIGEIRDRVTMDAVIEMAESGHLVIGTMHTKSCAETMDRVLSFYDLSDQKTIKFLMAALLKAVVTQRLLKGLRQDLVMAPEIMIVDDVIASLISKEKFTKSEMEDAMQTRPEKGNTTLLNSLSDLVLADKITLEQAKRQLEEKNYEHLDSIIRQKRTKKTNALEYDWKA